MRINNRGVVALSSTEKDQIVGLFTRDYLSLGQIAQKYGRSRTAIYKILRAAAVDTSKATGCRVQLSCTWCEKPMVLVRSHFHAAAHHFCSARCYYSWITRDGVYLESRSGQRRGRAAVEYYYGPLPEDSIVHHEDKNCFNSHPSNLVLFKNQRDHIRWHRGLEFMVTPLWVGADHWVEKRWPPATPRA